MRRLTITDVITIDRPADTVRAQFADVAHHQHADVHSGVRFELIEDGPDGCRYRQLSRVGPFTLGQDITLTRRRNGTLVNLVTRGLLRGGTITFRIDPAGPARARVTAEVEADLRGVQALAAPLFRSQVARDLATALAEDKHDLESGGYRLSDSIVGATIGPVGDEPSYDHVG